MLDTDRVLDGRGKSLSIFLPLTCKTTTVEPSNRVQPDQADQPSAPQMLLPHHHPLLFCADQNQNVATKSQHSCASRPNLHTSTTHQAQHNTSQRRMQGRSSNPCRCCNSHQRGSCWAAVWRIEHRPAEAGPAAGCGRVESTAGSRTTCSNGRTARRCVTNSSWSSAFAGC